MDIKGLTSDKKEFIDEFFEDEIDELEGKKLRKFYHNKKMSVCNEDSILNKTYEMWLEHKLSKRKMYDDLHELKSKSKKLEKSIDYYENRWGLQISEWEKVTELILED